jgi:MFS family permease
MRRLGIGDFLWVNVHWLGLSMASGSLTPIILPVLVQQFVAGEVKNTFYGALRAAGLLVAILVQPAAGLLSDRSISPWGRRRPFIFLGTVLDLVFLAAVALSGSYWLLFLSMLLLQFASNIAHGALQGLIPDLVPEEQRGQASGVKAVMELLPVVLAAFTVAKLVGSGHISAALGVVAGSLLLTMLATVPCVREEPLQEPPDQPLAPLMLRTLGLLLGMGIGALAGVICGALVGGVGGLVAVPFAGKEGALLVGVGIGGLVAVLSAIVAGVWASVRLSAGVESRPSFTWWVTNRLLFLTAVGSLQSFALYFLQDVLQVPNAPHTTGNLMMVVGIFTVVAAPASGYLADRIGRRKLVALAGLGATLGTLLLIFSPGVTTILISGCIIGVSTGVFFTTNWALGTGLVPPGQAGRYLGISNLAGAGAGIVGAGLGGPLVDFFNRRVDNLGYLVIFGIYSVCFLSSAVVLMWVREEQRPKSEVRKQMSRKVLRSTFGLLSCCVRKETNERFSISHPPGGR